MSIHQGGNRIGFESIKQLSLAKWYKLREVDLGTNQITSDQNYIYVDEIYNLIFYDFPDQLTY